MRGQGRGGGGGGGGEDVNALKTDLDLGRAKPNRFATKRGIATRLAGGGEEGGPDYPVAVYRLMPTLCRAELTSGDLTSPEAFRLPPRGLTARKPAATGAAAGATEGVAASGE